MRFNPVYIMFGLMAAVVYAAPLEPVDDMKISLRAAIRFPDANGSDTIAKKGSPIDQRILKFVRTWAKDSNIPGHADIEVVHLNTFRGDVDNVEFFFFGVGACKTELCTMTVHKSGSGSVKREKNGQQIYPVIQPM
ncbi:hypothetical protein GGU10DRAFT_375058 [Lentinula aff. detonsa]|uniref:Uncharacterized protein n=1 Tax=Lentinula aff. detonsa TaxID=2804958 RepID=A0AA38NJW0_9AGAR|nr:hypothetical protein GGU10DRAFT_375058 [Lentinula aff. detonsa]